MVDGRRKLGASGEKIIAVFQRGILGKGSETFENVVDLIVCAKI